MPKKQDPDRLNAILSSPSYAEADQDLDFLDSGEMRGVRLQLDYLKAELTLARDNIQNTIVVFGSTRIPEPTAARTQHASLLDRLRRSPDDKALQAQLAAATKALVQSRYYEIARDFGARVGQYSSSSAPAAPVIMTGGGISALRRFRNPTPTSRRICVSSFITSRSANCTCCCGHGRWWSSRADSAPWTSCSKS
jgi:hypothetical protein